jgi:hypothetical protein
MVFLKHMNPFCAGVKKKFPSSRPVIEMFQQPERTLSSPEGLTLKRDIH